jgi:RNase adaptor protein for sRNA GlmZ degradation
MKKYEYIDNNDFYYLLSTMKATVANTLTSCNPYYLWELFEVSGKQVRLIDYMYHEEEPTENEKEFVYYNGKLYEEIKRRQKLNKD